MFRRLACGILLSAAAALAGGCGTTIFPTAPSVATTETFTASLPAANSVTHTFLTLSGGSVKATLTEVGPDPTMNIGFSLGTFDPTLGVCTTVLDNHTAVKAFAFSANAATIGYYCVRVYDNGNVAAATTAGTLSTDNPFTYTITVVHP